MTEEEARNSNVPVSDEEEGAVLVASSGKAAGDSFTHVLDVCSSSL